MANEIYDSTWWGNTIDTASSIGTSTEMIQGQFNMLTSNQPNLVTNGDFSDGSTGWSVLNGTITDKYNASMTSYQNGIRLNPFVYTGTFKVTFDLVVTSGSCKFTGGGSNEQIYSTSGTKEIIVTNPSRLEFNAFNLGWVGTLDNVSVKQARATTVEASKCLADAIHRIGIQDIQN